MQLRSTTSGNVRRGGGGGESLDLEDLEVVLLFLRLLDLLDERDLDEELLVELDLLFGDFLRSGLRLLLPRSLLLLLLLLFPFLVLERDLDLVRLRPPRLPFLPRLRLLLLEDELLRRLRLLSLLESEDEDDVDLFLLFRLSRDLDLDLDSDFIFRLCGDLLLLLAHFLAVL